MIVFNPAVAGGAVSPSPRAGRGCLGGRAEMRCQPASAALAHADLPMAAGHTPRWVEFPPACQVTAT